MPPATQMAADDTGEGNEIHHEDNMAFSIRGGSQGGIAASCGSGMWQRIRWSGPADCCGGKTVSQIAPSLR